MMQRGSLWMAWRAIEPDVEPPSRVVMAMRRRRWELRLRDEAVEPPRRPWEP